MDAVELDRARLRRVHRFVLRVLLHALWWDLILNRPLLRRLRRPPLPRWTAIAVAYRGLAVELGGVLIKLGQFLSARLDVIPLEVAEALADLQDEVPAAPIAPIVARIEHDLGAALGALFTSLEERPLGSASLAQVHRARLADGSEVVVKVLRPGIERLVETDLEALVTATRWLRRSRAISRRVDVDWIHREFAAVTRRELDLVTEGRHAERFARDFGDDPHVLVPEIVWSHTATGVLTMSDVSGTKISDLDALDAAGVDRAELARVAYRLYMHQFFVSHFVHADPHPGNLFVHPRPAAAGDEAPTGPPFRIAFVDFGMVTVIPERLREALRDFAIGLGTRDARRVVDSYVKAGTLLPGADLERIVEAHEKLFDRFWGVRLADLRDLALAEGQQLAFEYRDLVFSAPVQLQADMVFAMRAVALLAGLCTRLDPTFDPWAETVPFARRFAREAAPGLVDNLGDLVRGLLRLPARLERTLERAERGELPVSASWSPPAMRRLLALERAVRALGLMVAAAALAVSGAVLRAADPADPLAPWLLAVAAVAAVASLLRR